MAVIPGRSGPRGRPAVARTTGAPTHPAHGHQPRRAYQTKTRHSFSMHKPSFPDLCRQKKPIVGRPGIGTHFDPEVVDKFLSMDLTQVTHSTLTNLQSIDLENSLEHGPVITSEMSDRGVKRRIKTLV